ncbi:MAG: CDGSH iron-sulfur domain-containing protein [Xanthomonadales bacterium]|nr:CDGSH iron-sulfur domain-containing protein [Xanthomonadales bacterium]
MEDATKATAKNLFGTHPDEDRRPGESGDAGASQTDAKTAEQLRKDKVPTDEKALDRWFLEQRGGKRVPKRLDVPNEALVTSGGPLKITGNITLIGEDGGVTHANHLTLCRCGSSRTKPICDEQHLDVEFLDTGSIQQASDCMPVTRPQTLTITCVKDGPLKYRGFLRVYNRKGQECTSMQGALCRCGKSTKKPFCDCQ